MSTLPAADTGSRACGGERLAIERARVPRASLAEKARFAALMPFDLLLRLACARFETFLALFERLTPAFLDWTGRWRARAIFYRAARTVPAYRLFLRSAGYAGGLPPETDKESYVKRYRTERRCVGGRLPDRDVTIDESSGSTGTPYNWVRSGRERHQSHIFISYFASYCYGTEPYVTINAFSMGAWATGINMGVALARNGIVKCTGPDVEKILHTLRFFGPRYRYLIAGYPPFLKHLIDAAEAQGFPFAEFELRALVGGEGMAEGLRDYLLRRFSCVYSGFGATDLEIGIAGETPLAVAIRRLCRARPDVRTALFGTDSRLPMLFQYNPLMHYIEVNTNRELLFTITRKSLLSPRVRYNVHDEGGVARFDELERRLAACGIDITALGARAGRRLLRLPFFWVYGRRDYTVSVMGANIYPEDIEQCLYGDAALSKITHSFCLALHEGADADVQPKFMFEVAMAPTDELSASYRESMVRGLLALNADFRAAYQEYPAALTPVIELYPIGAGPFASDSGRIKQVRLLKSSEEAAP
jgi:phenylacetate-CoA ligase